MTELLTSMSSRAADPGSQSCCLKVRIANTAASYRLSAWTSTVCLRPSVSTYVTLHDATARSLAFSIIFDNYVLDNCSIAEYGNALIGSLAGSGVSVCC